MAWSIRLFTAISLLLVRSSVVQAQLQNPKDGFCRRWGHQTTVIDDKLYIDGGWIDWDSFTTDQKDAPNTFLAYHDLNNVTTGAEAWPQLNASLNKDPRTIPTVAGGVLWGDNINKKFFVYGGESTSGLPGDFQQFSYDILYDKWDNLGAPKISVPANMASYGAGVGVSETGQGYWYGGWIKNTTMKGWTKSPTMSPDFYRYEYDTGKLTLMNAPDKSGRSEGAMVWIPAGDTGLLVYLGGLVDTSGNGSSPAPQPMNKILIFDPSTNTWFSQTAIGEIPQNRSQFCADVAWAPDKSSFNIYIWGGLSQLPGSTNTTAFNDNYVLTLPSFTWAKIFPDHSGNQTFEKGHYAASCNMVKNRSQMLVIGGKYPNPSDLSICDTNRDYWAMHNFWTGAVNNSGDVDTYWAPYNRNITTNVVPKDVFGIVGGDKNGGATLLSPKGGYDSGTSAGLAALLQRRPKFSRTATRSVPTNGATGRPNSGSSSKLSGGAIAGIVVGAVAGLALIAVVWFLISRRVHRRRQERKQLQGGYADGGHSSGFVGGQPAFLHHDHLSPSQRTVSYDYSQPAEMPANTEKAYPTYGSSPVKAPVEAATTMSPAQKSVSPHSLHTNPLPTPVSHGTPSPVQHSAGTHVVSPAEQAWTHYPPPPH